MMFNFSITLSNRIIYIFLNPIITMHCENYSSSARISLSHIDNIKYVTIYKIHMTILSM